MSNSNIVIPRLEIPVKTSIDVEIKLLQNTSGGSGFSLQPNTNVTTNINEGSIYCKNFAVFFNVDENKSNETPTRTDHDYYGFLQLLT